MIAALSTTSRAPAPVAWALVSQPAQWPRWAPHVRGARGLGSPAVRVGARGTVRLAGLVPVPVSIVSVDPGRAWTWRVGPIEMRHVVRARAEGCEISIELVGREPLRTAVAAAYAPAIAVLLRNLSRVAEGDSAAAAATGTRQQTQAR